MANLSLNLHRCAGREQALQTVVLQRAGNHEVDVISGRCIGEEVLKVAPFMLLADTSVTFNRFLVTQLNERLGQFVAMVEHDRLLGPEARLAAELAALFNPVLYPGNRTSLRISQAELAKLVGISRQHVNSALKRLEKAGLLQIEYGGITALNLDGLRRYGQ